MTRQIRFVPPGSLVEATCRTMQGRLFLQPTPAIADLCRGVLARAARLYPLEVHAFTFLGNHYHLLLTALNARRLCEFMNFLNSNLAREIGRAVGWREKFAPLVHAATRAEREAMMASYFEFASAYRRASNLLRLGDLGLESLGAFPEGCFPPPGPFVLRSPLG